MQHPDGGNHRKSSYDLGHSQTVGGVAQGLVVAVVHVGLDVVVGRVVVGLLHATFRVAALQHVAGSALNVLDHFATVGAALAGLGLADVAAVDALAGGAFVALQGCHCGHAEDGRQSHRDEEARHDWGFI